MVTATNRVLGVNSSKAVKVPCRVATTANISLSGLQTLDGITLAEGDRVLVKNQTSGVQNGIYDASSGAWVRSPDFDGAYDITRGTMVFVVEGATGGGLFFKVANNAEPTIGTDALVFSSTNLPLSGTFVTGDALAWITLAPRILMRRCLPGRLSAKSCGLGMGPSCCRKRSSSMETIHLSSAWVRAGPYFKQHTQAARFCISRITTVVWRELVFRPAPGARRGLPVLTMGS